MKDEQKNYYEYKRLRTLFILQSITVLSLIGSIICQILNLS